MYEDVTEVKFARTGDCFLACNQVKGKVKKNAESS